MRMRAGRSGMAGLRGGTNPIIGVEEAWGPMGPTGPMRPIGPTCPLSPREALLCTELRPPLRELRLQPSDDAGVHLADARLAQVERRADLLHRHVFVVVEDDDQAFVAVQAAGDEPHQI